MNALDRITALLRNARVAGGWSDEDVAADVLKVLGLDEDGYPIQPAPVGESEPTSSNLGHG